MPELEVTPEHPVSGEAVLQALSDLAAGLSSGVAPCGVPSAGKASLPEAVVYRFVCPWCDGKGRWGAGDPCLHCHGFGLTSDTGGWRAEELTEAPRPPAVMARPCVDCAYRPGSPEGESGATPGPETAFYCHHGLHRVGAGYVPTATIGGLPLGAMVCAGWWALATGRPLPERAFRDPGGSDRASAAPLEPGVP